MKITKFGHCCLLIEENGVRILTDPGTYSTQQSEVKNIDFVLITHEHSDHFHIDSLKALLKNNPQAKVITNKSVGVFFGKNSIWDCSKWDCSKLGFAQFRTVSHELHRTVPLWYPLSMNSTKCPQTTLPSSSSVENDPMLQQTAVDMGSAIIGTLIGLAVGGPAGALVGAAASPVLSTTITVVDRALERRRHRAQRIIRRGFAVAGVAPESGVDLLAADDSKTDDFLALLRQALESDPSLEAAFGVILGQLLTTDQTIKRDRLLIMGDALRGLRSLHLRLLQSIYDSGGFMTTSAIAATVRIPEVELRSVVRDLEARGAIKDRGVHPIEWELRTLGNTIVTFVAHCREV